MPELVSTKLLRNGFRRTTIQRGGWMVCFWLISITSIYGQNTESRYSPEQNTDSFSESLSAWITPEEFDSTLQTILLLGAVSLAPAIILMTTCFVRIVVVLGLLRAALGLQTLPSTQVLTSLALFMSLAIMSPVWTEVYDEGVKPYSSKEKTLDSAWRDGIQPIRKFMSMQIEATSNQDDIWLFMKYMPQAESPENYSQVPLAALLPAFMLSELKTAFLIGFQIFVPFLILDMVIASATMSMGMIMLSPSLISLPFKLLLFVLVDGWQLIVGMLMQSFQPFL
ncbi:MAG: flagellar biosynthetic protein FliP [Planctomycetaceae bacterium]|nr:flagellar biosynthetic protein FliP [Planctomycetaceae bacterium]|tara:strand:+ start:201 stop:1046 length:846 start_codon:yes stop_codon:yes gene_type:complete